MKSLNETITRIEHRYLIENCGDLSDTNVDETLGNYNAACVTELKKHFPNATEITVKHISGSGYYSPGTDFDYETDDEDGIDEFEAKARIETHIQWVWDNQMFEWIDEA